MYILFTPKPKPPILAVGSALHYLAHLFNKVNYQSAESFASAWRGFWTGVLKGEHGPGSFREPALPIGWRSEGEANSWYGKGSSILIGYYQRQQELRESLGEGITIGALSERRMGCQWRGLSLVGIMDRIDEYPDYVRIIDLKMGKDDPVVVASSLQPLFYQVGYEKRLRTQVFGGKPLREFATENLFTGEQMPVPAAGPEQLTAFARYLHEASMYIRAILTQDKTCLAKLAHFHPRDTNDFQFYPKLPRGLHCKYCSYTAECAAWERDHGRPPRDLWVERLAQSMQEPVPTQQTLPFAT